MVRTEEVLLLLVRVYLLVLVRDAALFERNPRALNVRAELDTARFDEHNCRASGANALTQPE